jgi:hypothetical protein
MSQCWSCTKAVSPAAETCPNCGASSPGRPHYSPGELRLPGQGALTGLAVLALVFVGALLFGRDSRSNVTGDSSPDSALLAAKVRQDSANRSESTAAAKTAATANVPSLC